jgi:prepilin-type N-terminal cleavage/methylation domain-containing protein
MLSNQVRTTRPRVCRRSGFTLIELLIVLVIMMALILVSIPALRSLVNRGRLVGAAQQIEGVLRMARLEAIKRGVVTVVQVDYNQELVTAFADLNDALGTPNSDLIYNPTAAAQASTVAVRNSDYIIITYFLPNQVHFWGAADSTPHGAAAVTGFTANPVAGQPNLAVFNPDGSIRATGEIRIGSGPGRSGPPTSDFSDNFLSVVVSPQATAKVSITKYNPSLALDPSHYYAQGTNPSTGQPLWIWY